MALTVNGVLSVVVEEVLEQDDLAFEVRMAAVNTGIQVANHDAGAVDLKVVPRFTGANLLQPIGKTLFVG